MDATQASAAQGVDAAECRGEECNRVQGLELMEEWGKAHGNMVSVAKGRELNA